LDFDLLGDVSDLYPNNWSSYYTKVNDHSLNQEEFVQLIEVGESFTMAASDSASIFSWGSNEFNELGRNEGGDIGKIELVKKKNSNKYLFTHNF
jgi:alpha-tubulin suppressor-like RCC1 family protein